MSRRRRPIAVRRLRPRDTESLLALRRSALARAPSAFLASPEDDLALSPAFVREALDADSHAVFGAFAPRLVGMVGVYRDPHRKAAHVARAWGLFVAASARRSGAGRALMKAAIRFARKLSGVVRLDLGIAIDAEGGPASLRDPRIRRLGHRARCGSRRRPADRGAPHDARPRAARRDAWPCRPFRGKAVTTVDAPRPVTPPNAIETLLNRLFGAAVGLGLLGDPFFVLEVRGRTSGRLYRTPVDLLVVAGRRYLVAPRGHTQWSRNARAAGEVTLRRGRISLHCATRELGDAEKPEILKAYLDAFASRVQRFFTVRAGSPADAFAAVAARHPVFELTER